MSLIFKKYSITSTYFKGQIVYLFFNLQERNNDGTKWELSVYW